MKKGNYIQRLKARIELDKKSFAVYSVLRILVILTAIRCFFTQNYESLALCILSLALFLLPTFFEEMLKIEIPTSFQIIIYCFIYAAEILGEINKFYTAIPHWDTMLHTMNGFLCAAVGFSMIGILNRGSKNLNLSPFYLVMVGFCFSMTIGVIWEFIEFTADQLFYLDMQKDFIISDIGSVKLDATNSQIPVHLSNIAETIIVDTDGNETVIPGGYLDVGIIDTMKDLIVNFIGAIVFSVIAYFYEKNQSQKSLAADLTIRPLSEEEVAANHEQMEVYLSMTNKEKRQAAREQAIEEAEKFKKS